jgi:hypothetical protein
VTYIKHGYPSCDSFWFGFFFLFPSESLLLYVVGSSFAASIFSVRGGIGAGHLRFVWGSVDKSFGNYRSGAYVG